MIVLAELLKTLLGLYITLFRCLFLYTKPQSSLPTGGINFKAPMTVLLHGSTAEGTTWDGEY